MTTLDVLVADDERPVLAELAGMLADDPHVRSVRTASTGSEALRVLAEERIDAAFLDIHMPGLSGLDLARALSRFTPRPAVVLVTADEARALEAFELEVVDYVLKPVRRARLQRAVERVAERVGARVVPGTASVPPGDGGAGGGAAGGGADGGRADGGRADGGRADGGGADARAGGGVAVPDRDAAPGRGAVPGDGTRPGATVRDTPTPAAASVPARSARSSDDETLAVTVGQTTRVVRRSAVRWVQAQGDYSRLVTDTDSYLVREPLTELEQRWAEAGFLRVHRSYLVQRDAVTAARFGGPRPVLVVAGQEVPVSRRMLPAVREELLRPHRRPS